MVKNREELLQVANSNAAQMKNHLRMAVRSFLEAQHVSPDDLAYVLGISGNEMRQILEGDGNVTVDVLSKLLVATDMAVEIKPVRNTPLGAYGPGMPRSGGRPGPGGIPVDENGRPLPPPPGFPFAGDFMGGSAPRPIRRREERAANDMREVPMETTGPARDAHGRFVKKNAAAPRARQAATQHAPIDNPYISLPRQELVNIIRNNIWDGEIDVERATIQQLSDFVANKERIMRERSERPATRQQEATQPTNNGGVNEFIQMLQNMAEEAQNNPALMDAIQRFMPRK
jgi:predicted XRE-type DNA-binding protein